MANTVKNYSTIITVKQTIGEVLDLLIAHGADQVMLRPGNATEPARVGFSLATAHGPVGYVMVVEVDAVLRRLQQQREKNSRLPIPSRDQAARVAWRTLQDLLEAQLEMIANGLAHADELFLPFRLVDAAGTTVYQAWQQGNLALPEGGHQ
jgi:hypothetical protein